MKKMLYDPFAGWFAPVVKEMLFVASWPGGNSDAGLRVTDKSFPVTSG